MCFDFREVIQKHVQYEYRAVRREKSVADFQQYITYKADFLKLVRIRMKVYYFYFSIRLLSCTFLVIQRVSFA